MFRAERGAGAGAEATRPPGSRTDRGEATFRLAIAEALWEEMERDERVFLLSSEPSASAGGGTVGVTRGFAERFGPDRVLDVPARGDALVGMAMSAAMEGLRPVVELAFADVAAGGLDELTTVAGTHHYRTGEPVPLVVRGPSGGGALAGPFHSQSPEPRLAHAPSLKVLCPAFPSDAKGLLKSAIRDDDPCVFLEHRWLYRRVREVVPDDQEALVPIGKPT
ncbi:MAG: hypothetical protein M3Q23_02945 [Actinomycetota bacterium]|nr:hypothetical protein [Actinomycetota bacterium]